jgi:hypothetical protein
MYMKSIFVACRERHDSVLRFDPSTLPAAVAPITLVMKAGCERVMLDLVTTEVS